MIIKNFGDIKSFYRAILAVIKNTESRKMLRDTGKLLSLDHRNWIKTSFLSDFERLVRDKIKSLK